MLTDPMNLIMGMWTEIRMRSTNQGQQAIMKNEEYYIIRVRGAAEIERRDLIVLSEGFVPYTI
jgi:hypothetical protein